jgi:hypothetical protein
MRPAPLGAPGELFLGGVTLARGYLGRPELTAERFVPDPFSGAPGARLYRTGDEARHREDGALVYLGRVDEQVKVRGFRIEPGEVEAALDRHPEVLRSAVVVEERGSGDRRLVAYWVPRDPAAADPGALHAFLGDTLPEYMVPGALVPLESLPLTAAGKVDRGRLSTQRRIRVERARVAPATALEADVAAVWGAVMGDDRPGMDDNFFAVGGHSLLATQLASRLRARFAIDLPVTLVFSTATLGELAREVEARVAAGGEEPEEPGPIARTPREGVRLSEDDLAALLDR